MKIVFVTGGCRSGKSSFAQVYAEKLNKPVTFVATAEPLDNEMKIRIDKHKSDRPAGWLLIEEPIDIGGAVRKAMDGTPVVILDCLTLWVCNLMCKVPDFSESRVIERAEAVVREISESSGTVIIVTNELGFGIVPADALSRVYRDCVGRVNQVFAKAAEEVFFLISGIAQKIK